MANERIGRRDRGSLRGRFRHGVPTPFRRRTLSPRTSGANAKVRTGTAPGQDSLDRVRSVRGRTTREAGSGQAGNVLVLGLHAYLRDDPERNVYDQAKVDREAHASEVSANQNATAPHDASIGERRGQVAAISRPRMVQLSRRSRQRPLPGPVSHAGGKTLAGCHSTTQPKTPPMDVGTNVPLDPVLVSTHPNTASVS